MKQLESKYQKVLYKDLFVVSNFFYIPFDHNIFKILINFFLDIKDSLEKKKSIFVSKAIPNHPPVFRNWYLKEFFSPGEWLAILLKIYIKLKH